MPMVLKEDAKIYSWANQNIKNVQQAFEFSRAFHQTRYFTGEGKRYKHKADVVALRSACRPRSKIVVAS